MPPGFQACCAHDHDCEAADCGPMWSLHQHVDLPRVRCLNEAVDGSARGVFRPWAQRLAPPAQALDSNEDDPELLIHVPFTGDVKIRAISVVGGGDGTAPAKLRVYVNREDLDFAAVAELPPVQEWDLQDNAAGVLEYPCQVAKFNGVHTLDLHLPANFGADHTSVHFIGFKGEYTERRRGAVTAVYEARAAPQDHKVGEENRLRQDIA